MLAASGPVSIYVRLSHDAEDQISTACEAADRRRWAAQHDLDVVLVFSDIGLSGYKRNL